MIQKIVDFVEGIKAEKLLKAAGVLLLIIGTLDALAVVSLYLMRTNPGYAYDPVWKFMLLDWIMPAVEITAGILAFYFIRHREKNMAASALAMVMVLLSTFMANLFMDFAEKAFVYVSLIPAYLYLFGAAKLREGEKYKNYEIYQTFYENHKKSG